MIFRWFTALFLWLAITCFVSPLLAQGVQVLPNLAEKRVDVFIDGKLFTSYRFSDEFKRPSFFPILSSNNTSLPTETIGTKQFELPFHPTLKTKVRKDLEIPAASVVHKSLDSYKSGENEGEMIVTSEWKNTKGKTVITEKTVYLFEKKDGARFINRKTTLLAGKDTLRFEDDNTPKTSHSWQNMTHLQGVDSTRLTFFHHPSNSELELPSVSEKTIIRSQADPETKSEKPEIRLYLPPGKSINFTHRIVVWTGEIPDRETIRKYYDEWVDKGKLKNNKSEKR